MEKIIGRGFLLGENIDTDQILPGFAMSYPPEELKKVALCASSIPDFAEIVQTGDIILADDNFGCGSSREQAPLALKSTGMGAIIASSFARIFRKNSINIGLPVMVTDEMKKIKAECKEGDMFEIDVENARLTNMRSQNTFKLTSLSQTTFETLEAGGLINKVRIKLISRGEIID
jgi:3-isopropylmalate dehydratase small subunit